MAKIYSFDARDQRKPSMVAPASHRTHPYPRSEDSLARLDVFPHQFIDKRPYVVFAEKISGRRGFHVFCYNASDNLADKEAKPLSYQFLSRLEFTQNFHSPTRLRHGLSTLFQMMAIEDTRVSLFERPDVYQRSIHFIEHVVKEGRLPYGPAIKVGGNQLLVHFTGSRKVEFMSRDTAKFHIGVIDPATLQPLPFNL